jgi:hypothetical protein
MHQFPTSTKSHQFGTLILYDFSAVSENNRYQINLLGYMAK